MNTPPPRLASLPEIEAALWRELGRATADRHHAWRTPVLATVAADGSADARTIVLRECDAPARELRLFTDARSAKLRQVAAQPLGTLAMWSPRLGWQLRLKVRLQAQVDGLAVASRWARLKNSPAAQDYLSPLPPGSPIDAPGSPIDAPGSPVQRDTPPERAHFALLTAQVLAIDWLELHAQGHRRAGFDAQGAHWRVP
jgi:hypothetical protein